MRTRIIRLGALRGRSAGPARRALMAVRGSVRGARQATRRLHLDETGRVTWDLVTHPSGRTIAIAGVGSAAIAAGTVVAIHYAHRGHIAAHRFDSYVVCPLSELASDSEALATIQRELLAEWGPFGPADMDEMDLMVRNAGERTFVIRFYEDGVLGGPSGVLQTGLADAFGDPQRLCERYPTFRSITSDGTWRDTRSMKGDTALLLQITAFGERSRGVGSLLRDAALYMMPRGVHFALTTTPVDGPIDPDGDAEAFPPAVRFHYRGGARPAGFAAGFKDPDPARPVIGRQSNRDVVFMRYSRLPDGTWQGVAPPPASERRGASAIFGPLRRLRATVAPLAGARAA